MNLFFVVEAFVYLLFYVNVVFVGSAFIAAKVFGIQVREIELFKGKLKKQYHLFGTPVNRRTIPINSSIAFLVREDLASGRAPRIGNQKTLDEASHLQQGVVALAGVIGLSVIAATILGPSLFGHHVVSGIGQILLGGLEPCGAGAEYVGKFFQAHDTSKIHGFAVLATKQIAFAALPIYGTPLHAMLNWPLRAAFSGSLAERISHWVGISFIFIAMIPVGGWAFALVVHSMPSVTKSLCSA